MTTLHVDEFADHPSIVIMCHDTPMVMTESAHERRTVKGGDLLTHRVVRQCPTCGVLVMTSLLGPAIEDGP